MTGHALKCNNPTILCRTKKSTYKMLSIKLASGLYLTVLYYSEIHFIEWSRILLTKSTISQIIKKFWSFTESETSLPSKISGSHGGEYEDDFHLGYSALKSYWYRPTFQRWWPRWWLRQYASLKQRSTTRIQGAISQKAVIFTASLTRKLYPEPVESSLHRLLTRYFLKFT
jgi:hypothetical protein